MRVFKKKSPQAITAILLIIAYIDGGQTYPVTLLSARQSLKFISCINY
jgi:hypothetical protein